MVLSSLIAWFGYSDSGHDLINPTPTRSLRQRRIQDQALQDLDKELVEFGGIIIREYIVILSLFVFLNACGYLFVLQARLQKEKKLLRRDLQFDNSGYFPGDVLSYSLSTFVASLSYSVSAAAVLLFPLSVTCHEVVTVYPDSEYLEWLDTHILVLTWNWVYLLAFFLIMCGIPFAFKFSDASFPSFGYYSRRNPILSRAIQATLSLLFIFILFLNMAWIYSMITNEKETSILDIIMIWRLVPWIQTMFVKFGEILFLISAPLGFHEFFRILEGRYKYKEGPARFTMITFKSDLQSRLDELELQKIVAESRIKVTDEDIFECSLSSHLPSNEFASLPTTEQQKFLNNLQREISDISERLHSRWFYFTNVIFPLAIPISLLVLTCVCLLQVTLHFIQICFGFRSIQTNDDHMETFFGTQSLFLIQPVGFGIEVICIIYINISSVFGLFAMPVVKRLKPERENTPMYNILGSCFFLLVMCTSFPLSIRMLGMTRFELMGFYATLYEGKHTLSFVIMYNIMFFLVNLYAALPKMKEYWKHVYAWCTWTYRKLPKCVRRASVAHASVNGEFDVFESSLVDESSVPEQGAKVSEFLNASDTQLNGKIVLPARKRKAVG